MRLHGRRHVTCLNAGGFRAGFAGERRESARVKPYRGSDATRHLATLECEIGEDSSRFILQVSGFSSYMSRSGLVLYGLVAPVPTVSGELGKKYVSYSVPNCPISRRLTAYSGGYLVTTLPDGYAPGKAAGVRKPEQSHECHFGQTARERSIGLVTALTLATVSLAMSRPVYPTPFAA